MPTLTIDNRTVTVPAGSNVLQAAQALGIVIPHFCYHEALGAVGACRLCAMTFLKGPVQGVKMSCLVEAQDGMVASSLDPAAQELRRCVIEWLMINHPHDCPVCDEGGECQLQDMTVAGGHGIRHYRGLKRTFLNQDLGPFVAHEMNRCIQCYRCTRTYRDYCGGDDFGVLGVNQRVYFGRFQEGRLQSPFSGNLVDVCPTGVLTDKTFRFKARPWDLQEAPSICPHCSLGCATVPGARYRELLRVRSGINRETNGFFLCDRGRFGYGHANHPDRPRTPRLEGREASWDQALSEVRGRVAALVQKRGPGAVAFLGSNRASIEANAALLLWAQELGSDRLVFECHPRRDRAARAVATGLGERARSLEEIRQSDFVLLLGADPLAEGPLLALAIRQAVRQGGIATVIDPRPVALPLAFRHLVLPPGRLSDALLVVAGESLGGFAAAETTGLEDLCRRLIEARRPVLVGGADLLGEEGVVKLLEVTKDCSSPERPCGAAVLLAGPDSFGGALLSGEGPDFDGLLAGIEGGLITALVCLQSDPLQDHPDPARVEAALKKLPFLVVLDGVPSAVSRLAHAFLPTTVTAEEEGTFVNQEGRMQRYAPVFSPGLPIAVTGAGSHPPREFSRETPGGLPRPAWQVLAALAGSPIPIDRLRRRIEDLDSRFKGLSHLVASEVGKRVGGSGRAVLPNPVRAAGSGEGSCLLVTEALFGSEVLASLSRPLGAVLPNPEVLLHEEEGALLGVAAGDPVTITCERGRFELAARLCTSMARRLAVVPRLRGTATGVLVPGSGTIPCLLSKRGPA